MFKKIALGITAAVLSLTALAPTILTASHSASALGTNLIANPSVETSASNLPTGWNQGGWGTNTAKLTYATTGHTGTHSLLVNMTKHTNGDAKWYFTDVAVKPSTNYTYSEYYESNVATEIDTQYTSTTGALTYADLSNPAASANTWKQVTTTFTTPANVKTMTVWHLINKVGTLQTDDFSLAETNGTSAPTAPTVSFTAPVANATVSGTVTLSATASDAVKVTGVQFQVDGTNIGTQDTTSPYSASLNTTTLTNGNHTITAVATNSSNLSTTATETINVQNTVVTPPSNPTVNVTVPTANAVVSGTAQAVTATATAASGKTITSVQFKLDGANLGSPVTSAPYTTTWNTTTATNASHSIMAVATDSANLSTNSTAVSVTVNNPTPPTVSITSPTANATVSGSTSVSATASDAQAIKSVQFQLDGVNLGSAVTTAPYTTPWDTTTATNGSHKLTAIATDTANLSTTSTAVTVTVSNTVTPPTNPGNGPNLIANPSFETATNSTTPANWIPDQWGTNTSTFSYLTTGHTGTRSAEVQTTKYTNGAAEWYYGDLPVTAGQAYQYTNWYKSNVDTEVDAEVVMSDGTVSYYYLGAVLANTNWTKFTTTFTPPAGAVSMSVYQILAKVGYVISDDYSLNTYTPLPFNRGIVSVSFDDGWTNQLTNAEPVLQQLSIPGTYNIISGEMTDPDEAGYMDSAQVLSLYQQGNEIASHTVHHCDLTGQQTDNAQACPLKITATQINSELQNSQTTLQNLIGAPVTDFAYPYGAYNAATIANASEYYQTQRSVNAGYNTKDNLDLTQLKIEEVDSDITPAQVEAWIDGAVQSKSWLILVYHEVAVTPSDPSDVPYDTQPTDFTTEMNYLKSTGVATETVHQAVNEILPQE